MARPVIALLTDFGMRDHYAGTMKGVILGICPDVTLVDISHDVPPHDVLAGALELAAAYRYFPAGTIFLVVVDPGVGSARPRHCGRRGRLQVRRSRQRRAQPGRGEPSTEARRRAERAAVRAADGQPHVRGARSVCAGSRVAGEGRRSRRARPAAPARCIASMCRSRRSNPDRAACSARCFASIGSAI